MHNSQINRLQCIQQSPPWRGRKSHLNDTSPRWRCMMFFIALLIWINVPIWSLYIYNDTNMSLFQESSNIVTSQQQSLLKGLAVILSQEPKDTHPPGLLQQLCRSSLQCLHRAPRCARTTLEQGSLNFLPLEACRHSYSQAAPLSLLSLQHIAPSCVLPRMRAPHKNH